MPDTCLFLRPGSQDTTNQQGVALKADVSRSNTFASCKFQKVGTLLLIGKASHRTTNTRPQPQNTMLLKTGYFAKTHISLPFGRLMIERF
jgi:hypothetical protein